MVHKSYCSRLGTSITSPAAFPAKLCSYLWCESFSNTMNITNWETQPMVRMASVFKSMTLYVQFNILLIRNHFFNYFIHGSTQFISATFPRIQMRQKSLPHLSHTPTPYAQAIHLLSYYWLHDIKLSHVHHVE